MMAGTLDIFWGSAAFAKPAIASGKIKALGVASDRRSLALPDLRTLAEQGFNGYELYGWTGFVLPAGTPVRRVPVHINDERLLGGLDLTATLQAGRPVAQRGILTQADGGVVVLAMAERLAPPTAARIVAVLDTHEVALERDGLATRTPARFGVVALDEGQGDDERVSAALLDRLALTVDLVAVPRKPTAAGDVDPSMAQVLAEMLPLQRADFLEIFKQCAGKQVRRALLRPP
jgi:hypothetical protein